MFKGIEKQSNDNDDMPSEDEEKRRLGIPVDSDDEEHYLRGDKSVENEEDEEGEEEEVSEYKEIVDKDLSDTEFLDEQEAKAYVPSSGQEADEDNLDGNSEKLGDEDDANEPLSEGRKKQLQEFMDREQTNKAS
ncbi:MAG: hypothetical protein NTY12_05180 [Candidatus Falkowbacteria bacterium]|nr:hypothetical protein [Candidatus Falkowbacteria bacterium]